MAPLLAAVLVALVGGTRAAAQEPFPDSVPTSAPAPDSLTAAKTAFRHKPAGAGVLRIVISLAERRLWVLEQYDTLMEATIGVARGVTFVHGSERWEFRTPYGERRVRRKVEDPVWTPPDWHYAETARNHGLRLARLAASGTRLSTGARLLVRDSVVGLVFPGGDFAALPLDEHIVFDGTLFIPPLGTLNRRVTGDLGRYALDLGDGYMIHGTPIRESIGRASTHGCVRVGDDDLAWLYANIPVGTRVVIR
jgi:lipoprotein-anchoring transpeptidase ErfK/SrfK